MQTVIRRMKQMLQRLELNGGRALRRSALLGLLVLALMSVQGASAQGITGSITGTVTDSTGAAIPDATVTIRNAATNSVHTIKTSEVGSYTVPQLPPGQYTVEVDKATFKSYKQSAITLSIDQVA